MSAEEIRAAINDVQQRVMAERQKSLKEQAEKNLSEAKPSWRRTGKRKE